MTNTEVVLYIHKDNNQFS